MQNDIVITLCNPEACETNGCVNRHFIVVIKEVEILNLAPFARALGVYVKFITMFADRRVTYAEYSYFVCTSLTERELGAFLRNALPVVGGGS